MSNGKKTSAIDSQLSIDKCYPLSELAAIANSMSEDEAMALAGDPFMGVDPMEVDHRDSPPTPRADVDGPNISAPQATPAILSANTQIGKDGRIISPPPSPRERPSLSRFELFEKHSRILNTPPVEDWVDYEPSEDGELAPPHDSASKDAADASNSRSVAIDEASSRSSAAGATDDGDSEMKDATFIPKESRSSGADAGDNTPSVMKEEPLITNATNESEEIDGWIANRGARWPWLSYWKTTSKWRGLDSHGVKIYGCDPLRKAADRAARRGIFSKDAGKGDNHFITLFLRSRYYNNKLGGNAKTDMVFVGQAWAAFVENYTKDVGSWHARFEKARDNFSKHSLTGLAVEVHYQCHELGLPCAVQADDACTVCEEGDPCFEPDEIGAGDVIRWNERIPTKLRELIETYQFRLAKARVAGTLPARRGRPAAGRPRAPKSRGKAGSRATARGILAGDELLASALDGPEATQRAIGSDRPLPSGAAEVAARPAQKRHFSSTIDEMPASSTPCVQSTTASSRASTSSQSMRSALPAASVAAEQAAASLQVQSLSSEVLSLKERLSQRDEQIGQMRAELKQLGQIKAEMEKMVGDHKRLLGELRTAGVPLPRFDDRSKRHRSDS